MDIKYRWLLIKRCVELQKYYFLDDVVLILYTIKYQVQTYHNYKSYTELIKFHNLMQVPHSILWVINIRVQYGWVLTFFWIKYPFGCQNDCEINFCSKFCMTRLFLWAFVFHTVISPTSREFLWWNLINLLHNRVG